jgi:transcriptional regulator with GAF, ATPase, and Fis domain/serine/threonine protein kinase/Tfp pilus assembly protein PilF
VQTPSCRLYRFRELISQNNLCQTWLAVRQSTGAQCLVKSLAADSSLSPESAQSVLLESYRCQRQLASHRVITATCRQGEGGQPFIEYPLIDRSRYQPLSPTLLWNRFDAVFSQVCIITDYLHSLGYVHCDLKLDNFLVDVSGEDSHVVLVDLDFLCRANISPEARVIGTPDHIAPEILSNNRIVIQSDNYSLGVSLREFAQSLPESGGEFAHHRAIAAALVSELTQEDSLHRPRFLVEFAARLQVFDSARIDVMRREVLAMVLLTHFRKTRHNLTRTDRLTGLLRFKANVLGPGDELLGEFSTAYVRDRCSAFSLFRQLVSKAGVSRLADYWALSLSDDLLETLYASLAEITGCEYAHCSSPSASADSVMAGVQTLEKAGKLEQAYLCLRKTYGHMSESMDADTRRAHCHKLALLAHVLNRIDDARTHWLNLADLSAPGSDERIEALGRLANYAVNHDEPDKAREYVERGSAEVGPDRRDFFALQLTRVEGVIAMARNDYSLAAQRFNDLYRDASDAGQLEVAVQARYCLGAMAVRQGLTEAHRKHLEDAMELAEKSELLHKSVAVMAVLAGAYATEGDFERAIEFGKMAINSATSPDQAYALPFAYGTLAWSYTRVADLQKAEHWLYQSLNLTPLSQVIGNLRGFYNSLGGLRAQQGRLHEADVAWQKVLELSPPGTANIAIAGTLKYIAEWAVYRDDRPAFRDSSDKARDLARRIGNTDSLVELDQYESLYQYYYQDSRDHDTLLGQIQRFIECHWRYDAVRGLFPLLLESNAGLQRRILKETQPLRGILRKSRVPIFRVTELVLAHMETQDSGQRLPVSVWKQAFTILLRGSPPFYAMHIALKIAELYQDESRYTIARSYLVQARLIAEGLGNQHYLGIIGRRLKRISNAAEDYARLVDSFKAISDVLRNIGDYGESIRRLVQFAVDQSGAERGVLLLKNKQSPGLHVAASVNCDDPSLNDITDFSTHIPATSLEDLEPFVVDNALTDERTRKYKSIAHHNIMSVTCVPLLNGSESIGALYLDHHTIPALFSRQDVVYIQSVANFISIALTTVQDYRNVGLKNLQLKHDIRRLGGEGRFLTADQATRALLEKVPEIARTGGPVLIMGESGTGKEPLARLIHELSPRAGQPHVTVNCSAIQGPMIEAELFGHVKGAFTDARDDRPGRIEDASGGTLFLDEIGEMPLEAQPRVLRVLDGQDFYRVGGNRLVHVDCRFIAATNRNLNRMVDEGRFRSDLFHRINRFVLEIPPLRDRQHDIPLLIHHFLNERFSSESSGKFSSARTMQALLSYRWPGNVRELINFVERCCILHPGRRIEPHMLPPEMQAADGDGNLSKARLDELETARCKEALKRAGGNQSKAARSLGMPLSTFRRKLRGKRSRGDK